MNWVFPWSRGFWLFSEFECFDFVLQLLGLELAYFGVWVFGF